MDIATLSRMIENLIRIGTVHDVDLAAPRCRVASGELITGWLPMPSQRAGTTRKWSPLTVGEQVIIVSPSGELAAGCVLPLGIFSDSIAPPSSSADVELTEYPDGAIIGYNHATHELSVGGINKLTIVATGDVCVDNDGDAIVNCKGALNATVGGKANVTANQIELDGGGVLDPVVTQKCACALTGLDHPMASTTVKASM